jgi:hypothetical protein
MQAHVPVTFAMLRGVLLEDNAIYPSLSCRKTAFMPETSRDGATVSTRLAHVPDEDLVQGQVRYSLCINQIIGVGRSRAILVIVRFTYRIR